MVFTLQTASDPLGGGVKAPRPVVTVVLGLLEQQLFVSLFGENLSFPVMSRLFFPSRQD